MAKKTTLKDLLDNIDLDHFLNGWNMWPAWWNDSTSSWQLGYMARAHKEKTEKRMASGGKKNIEEIE